MGFEYSINGLIVERGDDASRKVYDKDNKVIRDYTADENRELDLHLQQQTETTLIQQVKAQRTALRAAIGPGDAPAGTDSLNAITNQTNATINSSPAQYIKALARLNKDIARATIRLARLVTEDLSTPPTD